LGLLGLKWGFSKSFGEVLGFLNIGLDIVPGLLNRRMGDHESLELKRLIVSLVRGYVNFNTLHLGWNFLNICIKVAQACWLWVRASWTLKWDT
jgi:hypothetical protein